MRTLTAGALPGLGLVALLLLSAVAHAADPPNLGHAWSGGDARGTHTAAWGPNATELMLDFLLTQR